MNCYNRLVKQLPLAAIVLLLFSVAGFAQNKVSISKAIALPTDENPNHWQLLIGFNAGFDVPVSLSDLEDPKKSPIKNPANFYLLDVGTGQRLGVVYIFFDTNGFYAGRTLNPSAGHPDAVTVYLDPSVRLDPTHHYHVYVLNVSFRGKPTDDPQPQSFVEFPKVVAAVPAPETEQGDPAIRDSLSFTDADGREDANIYLSGEYSGASGTKFNGSVDIKIDIPFRKIIRNRIHSFDPFFELKASTDPKADPDSMSFGLNWEWPIWRYRGDNLSVPIRRIVWRNAPKIESDKSFDNTNFIWESRFRFMSRTYSGKHMTFYFRPFIGQELGTNIKSPVKEAQGKFLYRPIAGTTLNLIFPIHGPGLEDISLEGSYIRRWPLRSEVSFEEDDDGNLKALAIGKSPRDYVTAKANFDFTKAFGLSVGYEYGELPPNFQLVDHKTTIGLTYKIKIDR
ncbi:MAG: hypothetical protein QOF62_2420 [Pyrinomonadaceae bacterium]|jgi:hypothetical protein|nr:hypothetical protein [Pyrinomonadaceae bacterium]